MKIKIKGKTYLESDDKQLLIKTYSGKQNDKGVDIFRTEAYYGTLEQAMNGIIRSKILESEATTFKELADDIKQIKTEVRELLGL